MMPETRPIYFSRNSGVKDQMAAPMIEAFAAKAGALIAEIPIEGVAALAASVAIRLFSAALSAPLQGIGISIIATKLVFKIIDCYDPKLTNHLAIEALKLNKNYPKLQTIAFCFTLAISYLSRSIAFISGSLLGFFFTIIIDVENYKLIQRHNRNLPLKKQNFTTYSLIT